MARMMVIVALWASATAQATDVVVCVTLLPVPDDPSCQFETLAEGIAAAGPGDVIQVGSGTYPDSTTSISVAQTYDIQVLDIPAIGGRPIFTSTSANILSISGDAVVNIDGLEFGPGNRGIHISGNAVVTLTDVIVRDCVLETDGNGIFVGAGGTAELFIFDSLFTGNGNQADGNEGGHLFTYRPVTIDNTIFEFGKGQEGGAIWAEGPGDVGGAAGALTITNSTFDQNEADFDGGAIFTKWAVAVSISDSVFTANSVVKATGDGGAIAVWDGAPVILTDNTFTDNSARWGGAIYGLTGADIEVYGGAFDSQNLIGTDVADSGGGIYLESGTLIVDGTTFSDLTATTNGGAITSVSSGSLSITDSAFSRNSAADGGALSTSSAGPLDITRTEFCLNTATAEGGALWIFDGSGNGIVDFTSVVFVDNSSAEAGGGLYLNGAMGTVINNTFAGNESGTNQGGIYLSSDALTWVNNAVSDSVGVGMFVSSTTFANRAYTLWFGNTPTHLGGDLSDGIDLSGIGVVVDEDPLYADYTDDGVCNDSMWPGVGSPLINAGDPSILDLDGSTSDIGAYGGLERADPDVDGDGFGVFSGDCDDSDPNVNPGAVEVTCNGVDDDCDALTVDEPDEDGDGYDACGEDCNDTLADINPGMPEILCNGLDDDCDPTTANDADADGDGVSVCDGDCDDADDTILPGAEEGIGDGVDQDCDGTELCIADADGDEYGDIDGTTVSSDDLDCEDPGESRTSDDCDDADPKTNPGAREDTTQIDRDCDGETDTTGGARVACGCSSANGSAPWLAILFAVVFIRRRR